MVRTATRPQKMHHGFTIVELIVVVSVISILASIVVVSYNGAQERSRSTRIIAQASTYISALRLWNIKEGRPTTDSCIAPASAVSGGVCPVATEWGSNKAYDTTFIEKLSSYSGITVPRLGEYGADDPLGLMWYVADYRSDSRSVLYYVVGPTTNCGLSNVLSPNPGYDNMAVMGSEYTARDSAKTECMIEVFKY